jgi:hypothetical protein
VNSERSVGPPKRPPLKYARSIFDS